MVEGWGEKGGAQAPVGSLGPGSASQGGIQKTSLFCRCVWGGSAPGNGPRLEAAPEVQPSFSGGKGQSSFESFPDWDFLTHWRWHTRPPGVGKFQPGKKNPLGGRASLLRMVGTEKRPPGLCKGHRFEGAVCPNQRAKGSHRIGEKKIENHSGTNFRQLGSPRPGAFFKNRRKKRKLRP